MNERIRELAEQVEWRFADRLTGEFSEYDKRLLKFAELIVKECVSICKEKERPNLYGVREVENTIKEHFGVEK